MAEITNQLLRDAIADAETVRQTAIANAKITLEETFTPAIKSMLARRLRAGATSTATPGADAQEATQGAVAQEASAKEVPNQNAEPVGSSAQPQDTSAIGATAPAADAPGPKDPSDAASSSSDIDQGGEGAGDSKDDWYNDWNEGDFDLDEIIKELEEDVAKLSEGKDDEDAGEDDDAGKKSPFAAAADNRVEDEEEADDDATDLAGPDADAGAAAKGETDKIAAKGTDAVKVAEPAGKLTGDDGEELDLESIIQELEASDADEKQRFEQMASEITQLQQELAQYRTALSSVRGALQEVNLLNAKLLYTNRLFRQDGLNTEQKVAIVENFDRATTVREVKMVYTTLVETLNITAKALRSGRKTAQVVTEGLASKVVPSTAPKKEVLNEGAELAHRLKQLAGIL